MIRSETKIGKGRDVRYITGFGKEWTVGFGVGGERDGSWVSKFMFFRGVIWLFVPDVDIVLLSHGHNLLCLREPPQKSTETEAPTTRTQSSHYLAR
jgi:L-ascorbate metabolism protein UlaG (beta-lactamase superfamily)